jgi:cytidylate kinase
MRAITIAIDGPAGAGKSSVSKGLAERLGYIYIDTGAMYRALTLISIEENIAPSDGTALAEKLKDLDIRLTPRKVFIGDRDVTTEIRLPEVTALVSEVCAHPEVRRELVRRQRKMASSGGVVMEGRDIGTVVLPDADLKIYLTANSRIRAIRRARQLKEVGIEFDLDQLEVDIIERDRKDSTREDSPLRQAEDAVVHDDSEESLEESIDSLERLAKSHGA